VSEIKLGFIGFGEASFSMASGLKSQGLMDIAAYDKNYQTEPHASVIQQNAKEAKVELLSSLEELIEECNIVISATSSATAVEVARETEPFLSREKVFVDVNAASPEAMEEISSILEKSGSEFVDVAMMGPLPTYKHEVPILASGNGARSFKDRMEPFGMNIKVISKSPGKASGVKMFRSVFMKGLAALFFETYFPAKKYEVLDLVVESLSETMNNLSFEDVTQRLVCGTAIHAGRRIHEMEDVIRTLEGLNVTPAMSRSTHDTLEWIDSLGLKEHFSGQKPNDFSKVIEAIETKEGQ
jgi:3-hydroxyisobutyrate dehydrogenase-like beta-hydroxyacid dehydrogenase